MHHGSALAASSTRRNVASATLPSTRTFTRLGNSISIMLDNDTGRLSGTVGSPSQGGGDDEAVEWLQPGIGPGSPPSASITPIRIRSGVGSDVTTPSRWQGLGAGCPVASFPSRYFLRSQTADSR